MAKFRKPSIISVFDLQVVPVNVQKAESCYDDKNNFHENGGA